MDNTITEVLPTTVKASKAAKTPKSDKPTKATVTKVVKAVKADVKKKAVKLTKEQEEYCKTLTKEEQAYYREHGHLRGIVREGKYVPKSKFLSATQRKDKGDPLINGAQARILYVLSKARGPLTRQQITELTGIDNTYVGVWVGRIDDEQRAASEKKWGYTSLLTLKAAKWVDVEVEGRTVSCGEITVTGKKLLEQYDKVQKESEKPTAEQQVKAKMKSKKDEE